jgi:hypothetical protein
MSAGLDSRVSDGRVHRFGQAARRAAIVDAGKTRRGCASSPSSGDNASTSTGSSASDSWTVGLQIEGDPNERLPGR